MLQTMTWNSLRWRTGYLAALLLVTLGVTACSGSAESQDTTLAQNQTSSSPTGSGTASPTVSIIVPTSASTFPLTSNDPTITVSGTAQSNAGIIQVTWSNNRGGSGTATS